MRLLMILLTIATVALADVEIVPLCSDSDVSFVSWIGADEYAHLGRYEGDSLITQITSADKYDASVGVCEFQPDSYIVLYITSTLEAFEYDTLLTLSPSILSTLDYLPLFMEYEHCHYGFLKHPDSKWDAFLASYAYTCYSSLTSCYWKSMELSVSASGEVNCLSSLDYSNYMDAGLNTDLPQVFSFLGPVSDGSNWPEFCSSVIEPGGSWPSWAGLSSCLHNPLADSTNLLFEGFYGAFDTLPDYPPCLMALGSCSDKAVLLWEDAYGQVFFSDFDCVSPGIVSTTQYPWAHPNENNSCAMSSNPDDTGMLLAWYQSGLIRCRYYQDGWNDFDHIADTGVSTVDESNIAVSSVDDGYWIAWLDNSSSEPELVFIDRGTVTGIETESTEPLSPEIELYPNPCNRFLSIEYSGLSLSGSARILIHECSGRLVNRIDLESEEQVVIWDCSDRSGNRCEHGIYFVSLVGNGASVTEKVLLLE